MAWRVGGGGSGQGGCIGQGKDGPWVSWLGEGGGNGLAEIGQIHPPGAPQIFTRYFAGADPKSLIGMAAA